MKLSDTRLAQPVGNEAIIIFFPRQFCLLHAITVKTIFMAMIWERHCIMMKIKKSNWPSLARFHLLFSFQLLKLMVHYQHLANRRLNYWLYVEILWRLQISFFSISRKKSIFKQINFDWYFRMQWIFQLRNCYFKGQSYFQIFLHLKKFKHFFLISEIINFSN